MSLMCPKCNKENTDKAIFCSNCGETLDKDKDFKRYDSIGGWLILVGIGVAFAPLVYLGDLNKLYELLRRFENVLVMQEYLNNLIMMSYINLALSLVMAYMFFSKKSYFPKSFIALLIYNIIVVFVVASMASSMAIDNEEVQSAVSFETFQDAIKAIVRAAILIPYMLISKRVKGTFTK